jgi:hypothetical protein
VSTDTTLTGSLVRSSVILSAPEADTAGILIRVTGQTATALANMVVCNALVIGGYN